jgi:hypothetical protein
MSCNCKANEKILKIHKVYGKEISTPWIEKAQFKTSEIIKILLAGLISLLLSPVIFIFLIIRSIQGKTVIDINKILRKLLRHNKNGRI